MQVGNSFYEGRNQKPEYNDTFDKIDKYVDDYFDNDLSIEELKEAMKEESEEVQKQVLLIVS